MKKMRGAIPPQDSIKMKNLNKEKDNGSMDTTQMKIRRMIHICFPIDAAVQPKITGRYTWIVRSAKAVISGVRYSVEV